MRCLSQAPYPIKIVLLVCLIFLALNVASVESVKPLSAWNRSLGTRNFRLTYNTTNSTSNQELNITSVFNNTNNTVSNSTVTESLLLQGWTSDPNGRGTLTIIYGCCSTIFLCCWCVLCINVPPANWGRWRRIHEKVLVACMGGLGPEFVFQLALGQWVSARSSVADFRRSGFARWTMTHAFLADMGGFVLHAPDFVPFPLNAKQVHFLVTNGYVPYSVVAIDTRVISEKNKGGGLVRFITVSQILWFSVNSIARVVQHLDLTTMELSTLAFIICTLGTYVLWANKPMDVENPIVLTPNTTLRDILIRAGDGAQAPYRATPLDFVCRERSSWYLYWTYWMNIIRKLRLMYPLKRAPIAMIPDDNFPPLSGVSHGVLFLFQASYAAVLFCGWNFIFPTEIEHLLWRISTVYTLAAITLYWVVDLYSWHLHRFVRKLTRRDTPHQKSDAESVIPYPRSRLNGKIRSCAARFRNNSSPYDSDMDIPLKALVPVTLLGIGYCVARAYVILEDWINLRALPPSAYATVNWSAFLVHL